MENPQNTPQRTEERKGNARTYFSAWENKTDEVEISGSDYMTNNRRDKNHTDHLEQDNLALKAYRELWQENCPYSINLEYAGKFRDYGANIQLRGNDINLKLSRRWKNISEEIQIGLVQELLLKILKRRGKRTSRMTTNMDLYNSFVKNIHIAIPKDKTHPALEDSFNRVNERYFLGLVEKPNLRWGKVSKRTFGQYNFKNDTITMNPLLSENDLKYLDYVMFHEMLHKQRKFERHGTKTIYHDSKFKKAEKIFENQEEIEKELNKLSRNTSRNCGQSSNVSAIKTTKKSTISKFFDFF
jgi:predicted metal-dependent hydrolase